MMKSIVLLSACVGVAFGVVGCEEKTTPPTAPGAKAPAGDKEQIGAATTALKDKAVATAQSTFDSTKKMMDDLTAKAATVPAAAKPAFDSAVATAKEKLSAAEKLLGDLKNSTSESWSKLSDEFTKAAGAASDAIKSAMNSIPK
jgi:hypothetical protein